MKRNKTWIWIGILSLVVALLWAFVSAMAVVRKSSISPDVQTAVSPLPNTFNEELMLNLETRKK